MKVYRYSLESEWLDLLKRPSVINPESEAIVNKVLSEVKETGDIAVSRYSVEFDHAQFTAFEAEKAEIEEAESYISEDLKKAIRMASSNIRAFHESQKHEQHIVETVQGVKCWQKSVAIEKVGLYIPGGTAPLFSTVLMLGIPAQIAGCKERIICTPPDHFGKIHPAILYSAKIAGINRVFKIGGIQAIAAMAYGTATVPKVYKIFGPGNRWVTTAKQLISKEGIAIDMPAGPSEVAIMADETADAAFVAADMLSQAEHGPDSQAILVTTSESIIERVALEIDKQLRELPRKEYAARSLEHSCLFLVKDKDEMVRMINEYAPEHLIIAMKNYQGIAEQIINAGSVFLGNYSCESAGDYASGTNHTLPTNGNAKAYSGVNLDSFVKKITFQELTKEGLAILGPSIAIMAEAESLDAHKNAVIIRTDKR
jgi:histidinol dehydrogenase